MLLLVKRINYFKESFMIFCLLLLVLLIPRFVYSMESTRAPHHYHHHKKKEKREFVETAAALKKRGLKIDCEKKNDSALLPPLIAAVSIMNAGITNQELLPSPTSMDVEQTSVASAVQEFNNQKSYEQKHERRNHKADGKKKWLALHNR